MPSLLAIAAHPDDIEFCMAGTMRAMRARGWELHGFNVCLGNLGSATIPGPELAEIRAREARASAALMGASWHAPCAPDLGVFYDAAMIRRVAAVVRPARPSVILTHSPEDSMEDPHGRVTLGGDGGVCAWDAEPRDGAPGALGGVAGAHLPCLAPWVEGRDGSRGRSGFW